MEKNLFATGLVCSLMIHALFIGVMSLSHFSLTFFRKKTNTLEVTYQKIKPATKNKDIVVKDLKIDRGPRPKEQPKVEVLEKKENLFAVVGQRIRDITKLKGKLLTDEKEIPKIVTLDLSRKITLPPMGTTKISNPQYISYNDDMRAVISRNIKRRAYTYVNHKDFQSGKVYLTFVLSSGGELKKIKIIDNKTQANDYLRHVAVNSVKESSPFPPFPIGFNYPEFTFNLLISFQE